MTLPPLLSSVLAVAGLLIAAHTTAHAVDSISAEVAGGEAVRLVRAGAQWQWDKQWLQTDNRHVSGYWDLSLARWQGQRFQDVSGRHQNITSIGLTPVFRWQDNRRRGWYLEGGIGVHYLSELYDNDGDQLSTRWQFGDHVGLGYVFQNKMDVSVKIQHFSNGSFKKPNDGVNFAVIRLSYPLD